MTPTYYQILELSEQATAEDIRRAYLRLVRLTHPDRTPDPAAHRRYLLVNEAYDALRQPEQRRRYDALLQAQRQPARPAYTAPFAGNAFQVLRVPYAATPAQIEQAYQSRGRILAQAPATDPAIQRQRAELEHAYATLTSTELRHQHLLHLRHYRPPASAPDLLATTYQWYATLIRRWCGYLLLLPMAVGADQYLPLRLVDAQPILLECAQRHGATTCWLRTTQGSFLTTTDIPAGISHYRLEVSRLFRNVKAAYLPSGQALSIVQPQQYNLLVLCLAVLLLTGLIRWGRLSPLRIVNLGVGLAMAALLLLLCALNIISPY